MANFSLGWENITKEMRSSNHKVEFYTVNLESDLLSQTE